MIPPGVFANHKLMVGRPETLPDPVALYVVGVANAMVFDFLVRQRVTSSVSMYVFYQMPLPRLLETDPQLTAISKRSARLICTTPEFDDLAKSVGLAPITRDGQTAYGATDPIERAQLRAELDGLVAHLYGLSEAEFTHILGTFPLVAALNAWRDVERGLVV